MSVGPGGRFPPRLETTAWLASIGMTTIRDVAQVGVIETCLLLRRAGHPVSLNMAYGLQADRMGTTWNRLPDAVRAELRAAWKAALARP